MSKSIKSVEEEFDDKFWVGIDHWAAKELPKPSEIKSFIHSQIQAEREKLLKEVSQWIMNNDLGGDGENYVINLKSFVEFLNTFISKH